MKILMTAALAALAVSAAAPAFAQMGGWDIDRRIDWTAKRIDRAIGDGDLDRREAFRVRRELRGIQDAESRMRYRHHGRLTDDDRAVLANRLDDLNHQIHWLRHHDDDAPWRRHDGPWR